MRSATSRLVPALDQGSTGSGTLAVPEPRGCSWPSISRLCERAALLVGRFGATGLRPRSTSQAPRRGSPSDESCGSTGRQPARLIWPARGVQWSSSTPPSSSPALGGRVQRADRGLPRLCQGEKRIDRLPQPRDLASRAQPPNRAPRRAHRRECVEFTGGGGAASARGCTKTRRVVASPRASAGRRTCSACRPRRYRRRRTRALFLRPAEAAASRASAQSAATCVGVGGCVGPRTLGALADGADRAD